MKEEKELLVACSLARRGGVDKLVFMSPLANSLLQQFKYLLLIIKYKGMALQEFDV